MIVCSFYTKDYSIYAVNFIEKLRSANIRFDIDEMDQEYVNSKLNQQNQVFNNKFTGCDIKVECIISKIEKFLGQRILFADMSSLCNDVSIFDMMDNVDDTIDMMFPLEDHKHVLKHPASKGINIGVIYINCNLRVLEFWNRVLKVIRNDHLWDQGIVNVMLNVGTEHSYFNKFKTLISDDYVVDINWDVFKPEDVCIILDRKYIINSRIMKFVGCKETKMENYKHVVNNIHNLHNRIKCDCGFSCKRRIYMRRHKQKCTFPK